MEKIIRVALATKFGESLDPIMAVIAATPNTEVATEILLGIYQMPENLETPCEEFAKTVHMPKFESYDPFTDQVSYSYFQKLHKSGYALKMEVEDYKDAKVDFPVDKLRTTSRWSDADIAKEFGITLEKFKEDYMSLSVFTGYSESLSTNTISLSKWSGISQSKNRR